MLVDSHVERAEALRRIHGLDAKTDREPGAVLGQADAVINALPNHLHTPVNCELLAAGIHVLCEKPLAASVADARLSCDAAERGKAVLAVAMPWRFQDGCRLLERALQQGVLGRIESYEWEHGTAYEWPTASGFYFSKEQAGGGILLDEGVHFLDCLLQWFGPVTSFLYEDDDWGGGIEANAVLQLEHDGPRGRVRGRLRLSRMYELKNRLLVRGEAGDAEILRNDRGMLVLHHELAGKDVEMTLRPADKSPDAFDAVLENFCESALGYHPPAVAGRDAVQTIELIERCYTQRRRLPEPWFEPAP